MKKWFPLIVIAAGIAVYSNSFQGPFIFDDLTSIPDNAHICRCWPLSQVLTAPPQSTAAGRPVLALSLALNYAVSGLRVWSYHALNVAIHIAAALILYGIARRALESDRLSWRFGPAAAQVSLTVVLIWLVHPLQTSSVTYVIQRAESLMGLFYLLTLYCAIRNWNVAAILSCALGMATKETMITVPVAVWLYDVVFRDGSFRNALRRRWRLYAALAACGLLLPVFLTSGERLQLVRSGVNEIGAWKYGLTQCGVILHYLRLAFWPHPLVLDYYWPVTQSLREAASSLFVVACLIFGTVWGLWRRSPVGFLGVCFFLILLPSSSVLPIKTEVAAEHRMYLPLASVSSLVVAGLFMLPRWINTALVTALLVGLGVATVRRNAVYSTELSIWSDTVAGRPENPRARNNLGLVLLGKGRFDEAAEQFGEAVRLEPGFALAQFNLGRTLVGQARTNDAIARYELAVALKPDFVDARLELGMALGEQGKFDEAVAQFEEARRVGPDSATLEYDIGVVQARQGNLAVARESFDKALALDASFTPARTAHDDLIRRMSNP